MDLDNRLATAQTINDLLKRESLIKFGKKGDEKIEVELEAYVKKHLHNLLLMTMGERTEVDFTEEEVLILKTMATKLKANGVKA